MIKESSIGSFFDERIACSRATIQKYPKRVGIGTRVKAEIELCCNSLIKVSLPKKCYFSINVLVLNFHILDKRLRTVVSFLANTNL